jgi:HAD superfamily hydrolase (TIGR01549 family)
MGVNDLVGQEIRAILFDLDGTLRENRPSANHALMDHAVRLGISDGWEKRARAIRWSHYYWANSPELLEDIQSYPDRQEQFWTNYAQRQLLALDCTPECAQDLAPDIFSHMSQKYDPEDWVPPEVPETLEMLKQAGYLLGVLSNRTQPYREYLDQVGLGVYFDFALAAGEVAIWKPDPRLFQHALDKLGSVPQETLYIGDNYYADVVGARQAGLRPILIDPQGVFADPGCPVIRSVGDLKRLLEQQAA